MLTHGLCLTLILTGGKYLRFKTQFELCLKFFFYYYNSEVLINLQV